MPYPLKIEEVWGFPEKAVPGPAPFDIDSFVNEWNATNPIEEQAAKRDSFARAMHKISRPFLARTQYAFPGSIIRALPYSI